ncbi:AbrB-like transcriptional regulator [Halanaeroarchaeum sp. HSR-CO]|nr:AbrB-like transcriptional regulator [Halanaeroarchaeum sp. HSR-CO]
MAKSTVTETSYEVENEEGSSREVTQYRTTVPKALVEAMNLSGAKINWEVRSADSLKVSVVAREDGE